MTQRNSGRLKRRSLLRITALGAGSAVASGALGQEGALGDYGAVPNLAGKRAIVVGSGFGGAVAAYRLAQAGMQVTVLERGRRWDVDDSGTTFCTVADPDWRCAWFGDRPPLGLDVGKAVEGRAGLIDTHVGDGITVLGGAGVGGGSLVTGMSMPQPRRGEWAQAFGARLPYDVMDRVYWPRARANLNASPIPADIEAAPQYRACRVWREDLSRFKKEPVTIPFAIDWDVVRAELSGKAPASHTVGEGSFGSNSGAKNSVDRNYLAWAADTGNVTVNALHEVTEIREVPGWHGFEVRCRHIDVAGDVLATKTFACDYLFLAAGTVATNSLLVSAKAKGWLRRLRGTVGTGFGNNGDFLVARLNQRHDVGLAQGGPGNVAFYDDANPYVSAASMALAPIPVPRWAGRVTAHLISSMTPERGEIRYDAATGAGKVHWPYAEMRTRAEKAGQDLATRLWWETGGRAGHLLHGVPSFDRAMGHGLGGANTWNPLGGMAMGTNTDFDGKSLDYPNLYCVDGSLLPGTACLGGPSLTVTANAERVMDAFIADHA
jgi:cholesterol oxidase